MVERGWCACKKRVCEDGGSVVWWMEDVLYILVDCFHGLGQM